MSAQQDIFVTTNKAAKILGIAIPTVVEWVDRGVLRSWKTAGGHRRISQQSIDAILLQRQEELKGVASRESITLLVVEDDSIMLTAYEIMIESWPFSVNLVTATNGFDALIQVGKDVPDIIITDLAMPDMDGFQMIRRMGGREEMAQTRIIAVTALESDEIAKRGGLPDWVVLFQKPAPAEQLKDLILEKAGILGVKIRNNHKN